MISKKRLSIIKTVPLLLIGLSIFILYLYFFVGIEEVVQSLQRADLFLYSLAFVAAFADVFLYSLAWQYFLRPLSVKASIKDSFLFVWVGTFVDLIVPAESVSGEVSKAYLMSKSSGGNTGKVAASIISHRILNMAIILGGLVISLAFFIVKYPGILPAQILNLLMIVTVGTAILLFLLILICFKERMTQKIVDWILRLFAFISRGRWRLTSLRFRAKKTLEDFHQGIKILGRHPSSLVLPVVFSLASWLFNQLIPFLVFVSLGYPIHLSVIIIVHSISIAIQTVPIGVPGEIGLPEFVMTGFYTLFGVPLIISAAATVLIRVATFWFKLLIGYVATQWVGIKVLTGGSS